MKLLLFLKLSRLFSIALFLIMLVSCSDSNLEPIGGEPFIEDPIDAPVEEDPIDESQISENPILRLNCGGAEVQYGDTVFTADEFFEGNATAYENNAIIDILATEMDEIYTSELQATDELGNFEYLIPITNGTYILKLHFAEIFWGAPDGDEGNSNARVFDVEVEGSILVNDLDVFEEVGALTAIIKEFEVVIEDQVLNIKLTASVDKPMLAGIEVLGDGQIIRTGL